MNETEMTRISVPLSIQEREALRQLAKGEFRDPREHVRYLLCKELRRSGVLTTSTSISIKVEENKST